MRLYEIHRFKRQTTDQSVPYDEREDKDRIQHHRERDDKLVGPHNARHLNLMLRGMKPAALLDPEEYERLGFKKYVEDNTLFMQNLNIPLHGKDYEQYVVTLPSQKWRADKLQKMYNTSEAYADADKMDLFHIRVGILLGYSNEEIRAMIERAQGHRQKNEKGSTN